MSAPSQNFGRRLLPVLVDELAREDPDRLFCVIPGLSTGVRSVSIADFARAVNRCSYWLEGHVGRGENFETLAYIGPNDIRYFALLLAAIKVGYKLLVPSPRNSVQNHLHVFEATNCKTLLRASTTSVDHILAQRSLRAIAVPELEEVLNHEIVRVYPYEKTYEEAKMEPTFVLHSSGSTGPPKPVVWYHASIATVDAHHLLPAGPGYTNIFKSAPEGSKLLVPMPFFHIAGIFGGLLFNLYWNIPTVHLSPTAVSNASTILNVMEEVDVNGLLVAPSVLEEMSHSSEALAKLARLSFVWYGGGPLSDYSGQIICKHTNIISVIGSTECGFYPIYEHESREDFAWFSFHPSLTGMEFQERADDLYEIVMTRGSDVDYQATFHNFPELDEYPTKDLYQKHPTKAGYWKHVARADDVIPLSNGEKVVGIPTENTLRQAPEVSDVIILGHGRFQIAALIEVEETARSESPKEIIKQLSPYIKHANDVAPGFARLSKDRILFTTAEKPMLRTPKGSIIRKATLAAYDAEINNLYLGSLRDDSPAGPLLKCDEPSQTESTLVKIFDRTTELQDLSVKQDIFVAGMDSLQVLSVVRQIKLIIEQEAPEHAQAIAASLVYSNPTIEQLARALRAITNPQTESSETLHARKMEETLAKYSNELPQAKYSVDFNHITVILTGSTGSLGSYLLDTLLTNPRVSKIYALNRASDAKSKQFLANSSRGLSVDWEEKVVFLQTTLGDERFGLDLPTYEQMSREAGGIIHNQWQVDFNLSLDSFEPHIRGVRNLIDFSANSIHHPPIFFISSISATGNWGSHYPTEPIPEQVIGDMRVPLPIGYGESKYISENLLASAGKKGVSAGICRVGQLAGPVEKGGMWSKQEWLPSLVASSKYLHLIPDNLGTSDVEVDWIPVDAMARIIVELAAHGVHIPTEKDVAWTRCFNLVNPNPTSWESLVPVVEAHLDSGNDEGAKVVPYGKWLEALRDSASRDDVDPVANPAIKLIGFFEGMAKDGGLPRGFSTSQARAASSTMAELAGVGRDWMETWMRQWGF